MAPSGAPKVAKTKLARLQETALRPLVILSEAKDLIAIATAVLVRFSRGPSLRSGRRSAIDLSS
jgi:hypothetical protein